MTDAPALLKEMEERIRGLLPEPTRRALKFVPDKKLLPKGETQVWRLKIYGARLQGFWSSNSCFYEIGVGRYAPHGSEGRNVGGAGFFCSALRQECGGGKYMSEVRDILSKARAERLQEFSLISPGDFIKGEERPWFFLQRRFQASTFESFPVEQAAQDAAWVITNTYPQISAMLARE